MSMSVFIVESENYSIELLNFYMEKELNVKVNNFFNFEELLMYLKLEPEIILYDKNNIELDDNQVKLLYKGLGENSTLIEVDHEKITHQKIDETGNLVNVSEYKINNIYFSVIDVCYNLINSEIQNT